MQVKTNLSIVIGYVCADMTIIIVNYRVIGDVFTLFHHCLSLFGYTNALVSHFKKIYQKKVIFKTCISINLGL